MKIAYVSIYSAEDPNTWSGLNRSMLDCLRQQDCTVTLIDPLHDSRRAFFSKVRAKLRAAAAGRRFLWTRDHALLRAYGEELAQRLAQVDCDVIFSPGTEAIAYLPASVRTPVVFWTDSPLGSLVDYYLWYTGLDPRCVSEAIETDTRALNRADLAVYSSEWAAAAAVTMHGAAPDKLAVIPFGPNLDSTVKDAEIDDLVRRRLQAPWKFLFVGVDWVRKGGDLALAVVTELNRRGYPSELDVVGCHPPADRGALPGFVRLHGFVNRRETAGRHQLGEFFRGATFFLLPTLAEAFGVVFSEAAAHALPVIAARTGGTPSAVQDQVTGHLLAADATVADYVAVILQSALPARYEAMARAAKHDSLNRLNWQVSGDRLRELLETKTGRKTLCHATA